jgi:hypothetical protein
LLLPQTGEAGGGTEFIRPGLLTPGDRKSLVEARRCSGLLVSRQHEKQLTPQPVVFRFERVHASSSRHRLRLGEHP